MRQAYRPKTWRQQITEAVGAMLIGAVLALVIVGAWLFTAGALQ